MSANLIIERVIDQIARRYGTPRQTAKARILTFGSAIACSINYSKLLHGHKYFFGMPAQLLDSSQSFGDAQVGAFAVLICGSPDSILVLPRTFLLEMMQGVLSRRLDVFVDAGTYILQTTKHPKCDVTQYLNAFPAGKAPGPDLGNENENEVENRPDRIHVKIQFALIALGQAEGCSVWVPVNDRNLSYQRKAFSALTVSRLPNFGFEENTRRIVQNIDVLWLKRNVIRKAFEIESTTSIYSGLLRLNDLVLAQPNVQVDLYIAAPDARREKVYNQFLRPSFQTLSPKCEFITFERIMEHMDYLGRIPVEGGAHITGLVRGERLSVPEHFVYPERV